MCENVNTKSTSGNDLQSLTQNCSDLSDDEIEKVMAFVLALKEQRNH